MGYQYLLRKGMSLECLNNSNSLENEFRKTSIKLIILTWTKISNDEDEN